MMFFLNVSIKGKDLLLLYRRYYDLSDVRRKLHSWWCPWFHIASRRSLLHSNWAKWCFFLECFHKRKGSITTQQKFEEKGLIVSTLLIAKKKMTHPNASHSHWFILPPTLYQPRHIKTWIDEENVKLFVFVSATTPVSKYVLAQTQNEDKTCPSKYRVKWVHC